MLNRAALEGLGTDELCHRLRSGETLTGIAKSIGLKSVGTLLQWIGADPERSARAREARSAASAMYDEQAQQAILDATDPLSLAKARELAQHLRWRASKVDPGSYGDKVQVDSTVTAKNLSDQDLLNKLAAFGVPIAAIVPKPSGEGGNA